MLSRWQSTIVDGQGNVQPGAKLVVFLEVNQQRATVYKDREGNEPYPNGEVAADEWGYAYFYAEPDLYRLTSAPLGIDWREVVVAGEWLLEAEGNAAQSAAQAQLSAQQAISSAGSAGDSADSADAAKSSAVNSAGLASESASQAASSADQALLAAQSAVESANNASDFASDAATSKQLAESNALLAEKWAQNPENSPVRPDEYSAYHWAKKAEDLVDINVVQSTGQSETDVMSQKAVTDLFGSVSSDWTDISNKPATATRWPTYTEVTNKPSTFPPSSHTHAWGQITGAPATATRWPAWGEVTGKPSSMPPPTGQGAVGTYALVTRITRSTSSGRVPWGDTAAGSTLRAATISDTGQVISELGGGRPLPSVTLSGTWRVMGFVTGGIDSESAYATLAVRIS